MNSFPDTKLSSSNVSVRFLWLKMTQWGALNREMVKTRATSFPHVVLFIFYINFVITFQNNFHFSTFNTHTHLLIFIFWEYNCYYFQCKESRITTVLGLCVHLWHDGSCPFSIPKHVFFNKVVLWNRKTKCCCYFCLLATMFHQEPTFSILTFKLHCRIICFYLQHI